MFKYWSQLLSTFIVIIVKLVVQIISEMEILYNFHKTCGCKFFESLYCQALYQLTKKCLMLEACVFPSANLFQWIHSTSPQTSKILFIFTKIFSKLSFFRDKSFSRTAHFENIWYGGGFLISTTTVLSSDNIHFKLLFLCKVFRIFK